MAKQSKSKPKLIVPDYLQDKTVWTKVPSFKRNTDQPGRFILKDCNQRELAYLQSKGIEIVEEKS